MTDVPFDVLVLVAKALLPYDLLSLSSVRISLVSTFFGILT